MPIGKDNITKRVAKIEPAVETPVAETVDTPVETAVKKAPVKKAHQNGALSL